ncbi:PHD-finger [Ancylostoma caninum]|uniref:PHD-finger n=1 Tax=Ancylostoma caninum TaxID=29170 RepID=A0A368GUH8_ANCCA|nr:PHD-finger [Ancylostoma caninum]
MTEAERKSFFNYTSSRGPGKRQIKPTAAVLDLVLPNAEDEEDDEDFVADNENGSNEGSDSDGSDSDGSEDSSSSSSSTDIEDEERDDVEKDARVALSVDELAGDGKEQPRICALCLNLTQIAKNEEVMQCDKCGLTVHDSCYMSLDVSEDNESTQSSSSMEPWFCEPCIYGFNEPPYCELCPSRFGAMKRSDDLDVGGRWVHLICALYTRGVTFGDIDHLTAISWQEMDHRNFGRKSCSGCTNVLEARSGVTTRCELGLCKQYYHATCAQRLGLLVDHSEGSEHHMGSSHSHRFGDSQAVEPRYINCRQHSNPDDVQIKKAAAARFLAQEEKRLTVARKNVLSEREERKRLRARQKYEKQFQSLIGVTICLPEAFHDKLEKKVRRARHLTTSPEFFEWFQEKAELSGIEPEQFRKEFTQVSGDSIPLLTPGFSPQFFEYLAHREHVVMAAEEQKLNTINAAKVAMKKQLDAHMTKLKLNEQSGQLGKERCERRKQLALAFHGALVKLGAKKIASIVSLFDDTSGNNSKRRSSQVIDAPVVSLGTPTKPKKERSINVCKECRKSNDQHLMIGCDSCHEFYHIGCLDPPLEKVPKKVNCEWHCADCCENSEEEVEHEENGECSNDGYSTRRLRQRSEIAKARRLAAAEEENRAYRAAILGSTRSSTQKKTPDKKVPTKRASLDLPNRSSPKRQRPELANGQKTNGISSSAHTSYLPEDEELGEDCFVILDDDEVEL